ncbi:hypothetical protein J2Z79_001497 [Symbiobacterium terraclitae]|uniref:Uncharacterized protein n=1 Tax=Symbiobacterium terraclitae TaxID=557451 RepID=A0ABS4JRD9_9FIRM|nr:DUF5946 family protein [Symbiobacterium terraclitae]MBP2018098.1 hypothetical protein [Symbiobacterium terraclitae]
MAESKGSNSGTQGCQRPDRRCPECGAPAVDGMDCFEQLGWLIGWEQWDPELAALHFVTVASYNLQHPAQFYPEVLSELRKALIAHLDHGLPWSEIRKRVGNLFAGNTRVRRPEAERKPVLLHWPMTIADVYLPDKPEGAADRVRAWAASIRAELEREQPQ